VKFLAIAGEKSGARIILPVQVVPVIHHFPAFAHRAFCASTIFALVPAPVVSGCDCRRNTRWRRPLALVAFHQLRRSEQDMAFPTINREMPMMLAV
jgi:hypothetical protein